MCPRGFSAAALAAAVLLSIAPPVRAALRLRVEAPSAAVSGTEISVKLGIEVDKESVLSWSVSIFQEGLQATELSTIGTDFERLSQGGYADGRISPDGSAYSSVAVLSFVEPLTLPSGKSTILVARCLVSRKDPGEATIEPREGAEAPDGTGPLGNDVLLAGGTVVPLEASARTISVTGCADFALALVEAPAAPAAAGNGAGTAVEVRRDAELGVDLMVRVESSRNLQPSGFTAAVGHDPELLVLEAAEFREPFVQGFVKADGFTRIEVSSTGVIAVVLSSVASPVGLSPGTHAAVRATYRFPSRGRPGSVFPTRIGLSEDLELDGAPARSLFQPGNALPCTTASLDLDLVVGPDHWIRGDTNADGLVDLSDGIHLLSHLFLGTDGNCVRAMETNSDGQVDLSDAVLLLNHLFLGGRAPLAPFPDCGAAEDSLPCAIFPCPA